MSGVGRVERCLMRNEFARCRARSRREGEKHTRSEVRRVARRRIQKRAATISHKISVSGV